MGTWWLSAAVPLEATSLLPIIVLPLLGTSTIEQATAPYSNPVIYLFLGGFCLAAAMERWSLHKRIAYAILAVVGTDARRVVLAFMLACGFLSMWISNTAAAVMMLPMGMAVAALAREGDADGRRADTLARAIGLGIAYSASIGGVGTLIGTPPNAIYAASALQLHDTEVSFGDWMAVGVPVAAVMMPVVWLLLVRVLAPVSGRLPGLAERIAGERAQLGPLRGAERLTFWVFVGAAAAWILREPKDLGIVTLPGITTWLPGVSDAGIAIAAALVLFAAPVSWRGWERALDWPTASRVPWGVLLLFGGGLALADGFQTSGLSAWVGTRLSGLAGQPEVIILLAVAAAFVFLTDFASNTAVAAMGMPLMSGIAGGLGLPPLLLMRVAAMGCSMAFLLPVSTPPNALVFSTGVLTVKDMVRAGILVDLLSILLITAAAMLLR